MCGCLCESGKRQLFLPSLSCSFTRKHCDCVSTSASISSAYDLCPWDHSLIPQPGKHHRNEVVMSKGQDKCLRENYCTYVCDEMSLCPGWPNVALWTLICALWKIFSLNLFYTCLWLLKLVEINNPKLHAGMNIISFDVHFLKFIWTFYNEMCI